MASASSWVGLSLALWWTAPLCVTPPSLLCVTALWLSVSRTNALTLGSAREKPEKSPRLRPAGCCQWKSRLVKNHRLFPRRGEQVWVSLQTCQYWILMCRWAATAPAASAHVIHIIYTVGRKCDVIVWFSPWEYVHWLFYLITWPGNNSFCPCVLYYNIWM